MHEQVAVKVNAFVDRGIAVLVDALNGFEYVQTVDSCQGSKKKPAYVMFRFVGASNKAAVFYQEFGTALGKFAAPLCQYDFRLQWLTGHEEPLAHLKIDSDSVSVIAEAILNDLFMHKIRKSVCDGR